MMPAPRKTAASRTTGEPGNTAEDAAIAAEEATSDALNIQPAVSPIPPAEDHSLEPVTRAEVAADVVTVADLKAWAAFERERNKNSRLGGNIGGSVAMRLDRINTVVSGIELLAAWIEDGRPGADVILSPEDREYWIETRKRHLPVPEHVANQLPPE